MCGCLDLCVCLEWCGLYEPLSLLLLSLFALVNLWLILSCISLVYLLFLAGNYHTLKLPKISPCVFFKKGEIVRVLVLKKKGICVNCSKSSIPEEILKDRRHNPSSHGADPLQKNGRNVLFLSSTLTTSSAPQSDPVVAPNSKDLCK